MAHSKRRWRGVVLVVAVALAWTGASAALLRVVDRNYPQIQCPSESRAAASVDLSFVAPATRVRITFSVDNFTSGIHSVAHLDNIAVVAKSVFEAQQAVRPDLEGCYVPSAPRLLDAFDNDASGWSGSHVYWDADQRAPTDAPLDGASASGSLGLGRAEDGDVTVRASKTVDGLVPGEEYVVLAWWNTQPTSALTVEIDAVCPDGDADTYADCSVTCDLSPGKTCGDCDDANPAVHPGVSDATCNGIDENCSGAADEGYPGGCQCSRRGTGLVGWWPGDWNATDAAGSNDGTLISGTWVGPGLVGDAFYFNFVAGAGIELPDAPELEFTTQMTLEAWVRIDDLTAYRPIITKGTPLGNEQAYVLDARVGGYLGAAVSADGTNFDLLLAQSGTLGSGWAHVATTFDTGRWKLYLNGSIVASKTSFVSSIYNQGSPKPNIGLWGGSEFVGYIDEPAMYNRALSAAEIQAIYQAGTVGMCRCTDADGDGYGSDGLSCPHGTELDCNDADPAFRPGAMEACNGLDDDCDDQIDEGLSQTTFYRDADGDGYGDPAVPVQACVAPPGYVVNSADCNDADPAFRPGVSDATCNGIDENCSGHSDEGFPGGCQCTEPATGLVSWWPGDGSANDVRGTNHGTLTNGATYAAGQVGQAFSLDGSDDHVGNIGGLGTFSFMQNTGVLTIAAWIELDDLNALTQQAITANTTTTVETGHFFIWENTSGQRQLRLGLMNGTNNVPVLDSSSPPNSLTTPGWHHVAVTVNGASATFYVDGVGMPGSGAIGTLGSGNSSRTLSIGRCPYASPLCQFDGRIDEVQIYDRPLGAAEVRAIHDAGSVALCRCVDTDFDGYGAVGGFTCPAGTQQDCNDGQASSHPGAPELCNGVDDDCDGTLDDGLTQTTFYRDADGDGYGTGAVTIQTCAVPAGYVANSADCNDANAAIKPGAADAICDGVDQNCNGTADDGFVSPPNGWIATPLTNAPSARRYPTMVSTGSSVIVWGGSFTNTGGIYRPRDAATDTWTPTTTANAPSPRQFHTAVWTGTEMIVWGGSLTNTGGRYNPDTNVWTATSTASAPTPRQQHTAVWTNSTMIVWGGSSTDTGGIYTPGLPGTAGTWLALPTAGAPAGRTGHTAVWTGTQMIVWGGFTTVQLDSGGLYDSTGWHAIAASPLVGRSRHTAVWTGSEMIVWGGYDGASALSDGASYNPQSGVWTALPAGPPGRYSHTAIWDPLDGLMVVWGGFGFTERNDGWAYDPVARTWTALPTTGAPTGRFDHAAAWLGSTREMVVWGGQLPFTNTGGRIVVATFDCGVGECSRESGYTCTAGQLGYGACTPGAPVTEVCNGLDDDCDGTIDNGNPAPTEQPAVSLTKQTGAASVFWPAVGGATGYDVVRGNLLALRSSGGDFSISTTDCLAHETVDLFALDTVVPAPGDGTWHLVRANACGAKGSYGSSGRDAEIAASGLDCPP